MLAVLVRVVLLQHFIRHKLFVLAIQAICSKIAASWYTQKQVNKLFFLREELLLVGCVVLRQRFVDLLSGRVAFYV